MQRWPQSYRPSATRCERRFWTLHVADACAAALMQTTHLYQSANSAQSSCLKHVRELQRLNLDSCK